MDFTCPGDRDLQLKWLEKHNSADQIVYDQKNGLPVCAVYKNPIYVCYVEEPAAFFREVRIQMAQEEQQ